MKVRSFRLYSATFLATLLNWNRNRRLRSLALAMLLTVLTGGLAWHLTIRATASGTISLTTLGSAYTQNFDTLPSSGSATWTNDSTIPGWYHARTGTGTTIVANDGGSNAGNLYSYGTGTATDRALGSVGSGNAAAGNFFWGVRLANNTGSTITSLNVSYTGEQWRNSAAAAQTVAFSYLVGSPAVTGSLAEFQAAGVAVTGLDFTSPITGGTAGLLNGNSAANRTAISFNITGLSIPNGTEVMLRWSDPDHTGSDHGLAIDDFSVTPNGAAALPDLTINDVSLNEGDAGTTTFSFTVNLSAPAGAGGVTFDIATADNTATQPSDYTQKSLTGQTIPAGSSTYSFTVLVNGDTTPETNETFFVNVTNVTGATMTDGQGQGTIVNDDAAPNLTINDVSLNEGDVGTTTFTFTVSLSAPAPTGGVTFDIATANNTAIEPGDYTAKTLTSQTIPAGSSTYTFDVLVNGDTTPETNETFFVNVTNVTNAIVVDGQGQGTIVNDDFTPIHDIQGSGNTSPLVGNSVTTQGIVTGVKSNGFYIQEPDATIDADPNTSEGIFVFTSSAPPAPAAVGNRVQVVGTVQEFITSSDPLSPPVTEIAGSPTVTLVSTGNPLPVPITLTSSDTGMGGVNVGSIENLERYEGMRVMVVSLTVVAPTQGNLSEANATSTTNGVFYGVITGVARPFREPGIQANDPVPAGSGVTIPPVPRFDFNPERLRVDSDSLTGAVALDVTSGATVSNLVGPLDYAFRTYTILADPPTVTPTPTVSGNISAMPVPVPLSHEFTVASFNMERFFDTVNDAGVSDVALTVTAFNNRLNKASLAIRNVLRFPDVIGVEEMENLTTLQAVAAKVSADAIAASQPDPMYQAYLVEGNDVGGIDVGFLVKTAPVFGSTPRVTVNDVVQEGKTTLFVNPDSSTSLLNDRPSLRLMAVINHPSGYAFPLTVIVNHLRSLSSVDDTTAGTNGWATEGDRVRAKRRAQAEFLANLIQARQIADPNERIVSIGDYNAFQVNDGYVDSIGTIKGTPTPADQVVLASSDLVNPDLIELLDFAPADQRYSFSFDGTAQVLDHELITQNLLPRFSHLNFARNNADFPEVYRTDPNRPERISDHDMPVAYFTFPPDLTLTKMHSGDFTFGSTGQYLLTVSNAASAGPTSSTITVDDTLPSNLTLASFSGTGWSCTGTGTANVSCTYAGPPTNPALAAGASLPQLTLTVNVGSGTPSSITNMATVSTPDEVNTTDNTASDSTNVIGPALTVSKSNPSPALIVGSNSTYTITVTNSGNGAATTATAKEAIPNSLDLVSASGTGWTCTPSSGMANVGTITCTFSGSIATGGGTSTISVTVKPQASFCGTSVTNYVSVDPTGGTNAPDPTTCAALNTPSAGCGAPVTSMITNPPPTLTYNNQSMAFGGSLTINPATGPSDNGTISTIVVQSQGTYTGTISVDNSTGVISISNATPAGTHTITVRATDNCTATTDAMFTLNVGCPLITLTPATLPGGAVGSSYSQTIMASGGTVPYNFALISGLLPSGLTLSSGGMLSGTPTEGGVFTFTVMVEDANNCMGSSAYTLNITGSVCSGFGFQNATSSPFAAGSDPRFIAVGDFNIDGKPDIAVANNTSNNVSVLLGNGSGGFGAATNFSAGTAPFGVAVGDLNSDGKPDIVVVNHFSDNISVFIGNGSGGFTGPTNFGVNLNPDAVALGDFNGDGKLDIAVANAGSNDISVLLGNGSGGFGPATTYAVGTAPSSIAVGDFNLDGHLDLAVANANSANVSVLLGNGSGAFGMVINFSVGNGPLSVAVGDFNLDGKPDLVTANDDSDNVSVLIGNGMGSFAAAINLGVGDRPFSVAVADFNMDGKPDLVVANSEVDNVSVLIGNGLGGFGTPINYNAGDRPVSLAVDDFNGDGKPDIVTANQFSNNASLLLSHCPPMIMPVAVTRQQGSPSGPAVQIATVSDAEDMAGNLSVAVIAGGTATGITIGPITNTNGTITATVAASCTATSGTVRLQVTDSGGLMATGDLQVNVTPNMPPPITAPSAVCAASTGNMASVPDAGVGATYSWSITNGTITSATNIRNITFTAGTTSPITLNVMVTNSDGCSLTNSQSITVNPLPDATITAPTQVCATSTGHAASVPDAGMGATYSWSIINGTITSATNTRTITFTAGTSSPLTLNVTVTSGAGCATSNSQNITVNPLATVNAGPDQSVSTGSPTVTLAGMVGGGATSGTWSGGTGSFNPSATTLNAMYTPSPAEIAAGSVTLTLTTNDPVGPCGAASDTMTITIGALPIDKFSVKITDPAVCTGPGNVVSVTAEVTNPNPTAQAATFTATLPAGLIALPGTCATTVNPGGCTITPPSSVTWSGMLAANQTVTITYQAQLANGTPPGTTLCIDSSTTIAGSTAMVQACTMINCPQVGPGQVPPVAAAISDQKPGSVLIYNFYTSNPTDLTRQNTRINITNTDPARSVAVHLFFVDGNTCTPADAFLCLTPNQTTSFLASDFDPGTSGYLVAVAVDERGCPLNFNFLIGDEFIKLSSGHQANIGAEAVAAIAGGLPVCDALANTATLAFDGVSYNQMPRVLAVDNFPSQADGNQTQLIINRIGGNLLSGAGRVGGLFGVLYDEAEQPLSFTLTSDLCQFRGTLNQSLRVVSGGLNQAVPVGHSGWLRLWAVQDEGLLGVVLNANPNAGAAAVNQGHNLHKLTFTSAASFVMPIIPPRCQ